MSVGSRDSRVAGRLPRWEVQADRRDHVGWPLLLALGNRDSWQAVWSQLRGQLATPVLEGEIGHGPRLHLLPKTALVPASEPLPVFRSKAPIPPCVILTLGEKLTTQGHSGHRDRHPWICDKPLQRRLFTNEAVSAWLSV